MFVCLLWTYGPVVARFFHSFSATLHDGFLYLAFLLVFVLVFGSGSLAFGFPLRTHTKATSAGMFSVHAATLGPLRAAPVIVIDAPNGKRVP